MNIAIIEAIVLAGIIAMAWGGAWALEILTVAAVR